MWYFSWMLGLGFALTVAIINAIWLESNYAFGQREVERTNARFADARKKTTR
jgi:cyd operon protein YbgT